jgi:hypothetical protein
MNVLGGGAAMDGAGAVADGGGAIANPEGAAADAVGAVGVEDCRINGGDLGVGQTTVTGREGDAIMGTGVSAARGVSSGIVAGDGDGATKGVGDGVGAATTGVGGREDTITSCWIKWSCLRRSSLSLCLESSDSSTFQSCLHLVSLPLSLYLVKSATLTAMIFSGSKLSKFNGGSRD